MNRVEFHTSNLRDGEIPFILRSLEPLFNLEALCLLSPMPIETIMETYLEFNKTLSDQNLHHHGIT